MNDIIRKFLLPTNHFHYEVTTIQQSGGNSNQHSFSNNVFEPSKYLLPDNSQLNFNKKLISNQNVIFS